MKSLIQKSWLFPIKVVVIMLGLLITAVAIMTIYRVGIEEYIDDTTLIGTTANFEALLISLWSSIVFFALIGITSLILGLRRPQDDIIDSRLTYLFSSTKVTKGVMKYNKEQVTKLCAFCTSVEAQIFVEEVDEEAKAFRVELVSQQILQNSFHNHPYVDNDVHVSVGADLIDGKPILGEIRCIELTTSISDGAVWSLKDRVTLTENEPGFSSPVPMKVEANKNARFSYEYWIWCSQDKGFFISTTRYCENVNIRLINRTEDRIIVDFQSTESDAAQYSIEPKGSIMLAEKGVFTPDDNLKLHVRKLTQADAKM